MCKQGDVERRQGSQSHEPTYRRGSRGGRPRLLPDLREKEVAIGCWQRSKKGGGEAGVNAGLGFHCWLEGIQGPKAYRGQGSLGAVLCWDARESRLVLKAQGAHVMRRTGLGTNWRGRSHAG